MADCGSGGSGVMTWATMVGANGGQRRAMTWVMTLAMTLTMTMARLTADDSGVDGGQQKRGL